jgi:hypothetical protein
MAEVDEELTFYTRADQVKYITQTNGDSIHIKRLDMTQEQAASMAWLVNADDTAELEFQVKVKGA